MRPLALLSLLLVASCQPSFAEDARQAPRVERSDPRGAVERLLRREENDGLNAVVEDQGSDLRDCRLVLPNRSVA